MSKRRFVLVLTLAVALVFAMVPSVAHADDPDVTPPTVSNFVPTGTNVAVSGTIAITFDEEMDWSSPGTVRVNDNVMTGNVTTPNNYLYRIAYSGFASNTTYNVVISGFKDLAGNVMTETTRSFKTRVSTDASLLDVAGQSVTTTGGAGTKASPFEATFNVPNTKSALFFSDLTAAAGAVAAWMFADFSYTYNSEYTSLGQYESGNTFFIRVRAEDGTTDKYYRIIVYRAPADGTAPTVVSVSPSGINVPREGNISITFSEPMDPYYQGYVGLLSIGKQLYSYSSQWSNGNKTVTLPYETLPARAYIALDISNFCDATGTSVAEDFSHSFTTAAGSGPDESVPYLWSDYYRSLYDITESGATLQFSSSEAGTYYYLVLGRNDPAPSAETIKAQGLAYAYAKGKGAAVAGPNNIVTIGSLTENSGYYVYLILEDAAGNISDSILQRDFGTLGGEYDARLASVAGVGIAPTGSYAINWTGAVLQNSAINYYSPYQKVLTQNITVPNGKSSITRSDIVPKYVWNNGQSGYNWWRIYSARGEDYYDFDSDEYSNEHSSDAMYSFKDIPLTAGAPIHLYLRIASQRDMQDLLYDITITREHPAANAPSVSQTTVDSGAVATDNSVTLPTAPAGQRWEYRVSADGGQTWSAWQGSPTFTGLAANKTYSFQIRTKADATHSPSAPVTVAVKTNQANPGDGNGSGKDGGKQTTPPTQGETPAAENVTAIRTPVKTLYLKKGKAFTPPVAFDGKDENGKAWGYGKTAKLTWTSSKKSIATVNATSGKIVPKKKGTAYITAKTQNNKSLKFKVVVVTKAKKLTKVAFIKPPKSLKIGATKVLKIKLTPAKATGVKVTFKSSKPSIIKVDKAGKLYALKMGSVKITLKAGGKKKVITVRVK